MKKVLLLLMLMASVSAFAQLVNADFENWYTDTSGNTRLTGWEHYCEHGIPNHSFFGTTENNTGEHGAHALRLSRWYNDAWDIVKQKAPVSYQPLFVVGYYKYTNSNLLFGKTDTALLEAYATKWNTTLNRPDTLGYGYVNLPSSSDYAQFICSVAYTSAMLPDSFTIYVAPTVWEKVTAPMSGTFCADSPYCSFLTIDNLSLAQTAGIQDLQKVSVSIYPNPAKDILTIKQFIPGPGNSLIIQNAVGQQVAATALTEPVTTVDIAVWAPGVYFLQILTSGEPVVNYKVVKE